MTKLDESKRFEILLVELKSIQDRLAKYDDLVWKSRGWALAIISAYCGWALADTTVEMRKFNLLDYAWIVPALFWLEEVLLRLNYVEKYVVRYRRLRSALNENEEGFFDNIPLFDLTNHIEGRPCWICRLPKAIIRVEQFFFYASLAVTPYVLKRLVSV